MRYRLTDKVQVQVARVDLEARRIEFRLVKGTSFDSLRKAAQRGPEDPPRRVKKAAGTKPPVLKGQTAKVRRAEAKKADRVARQGAATKSAARKRR
jgi:ribonuclease R